ncbi:MAG: hypothetical protein N2112_03305 [Gemmataceae bacterium]|nr:hypothetical protein [Gemmataceae bacterium]
MLPELLPNVNAQTPTADTQTPTVATQPPNAPYRIPIVLVTPRGPLSE